MVFIGNTAAEVRQKIKVPERKDRIFGTNTPQFQKAYALLAGKYAAFTELTGAAPGLKNPENAKTLGDLYEVFTQKKNVTETELRQLLAVFRQEWKSAYDELLAVVECIGAPAAPEAGGKRNRTYGSSHRWFRELARRVALLKPELCESAQSGSTHSLHFKEGVLLEGIAKSITEGHLTEEQLQTAYDVPQIANMKTRRQKKP